MTALRKKASFARLLALLAVLALVAAACTGDGTVDTTAGGEEPGTTEPADTTAPPDTGEEPDDTTDTTAGDGGTAGGELGTYTLGIFQDVTTDNVWNLLDTAGNTVWNSYLLDPTTVVPYDIALPGLEVVPELAAGELEPAVQEGDNWVGTITLRDDATWSDGEPITAEDLAFTWATAVEFQLTANWVDYVDAAESDPPGPVVSVEAVDDTTVEVTFNEQPGLAVWGLGNGVPFMPIQPEHYWAPIVEEARGTESPRDTLLAASGAEAPSGGATIFAERQEGSFAATTANESYFLAGEEVTSGDVTYTEGPYADEFQFPLYGGQDPAVLALANGEVDLLLNPLGMQRGFQEQVAENEELTAIVNPTNGYRFLAFNHARAPMSDAAFRDALTILINKEFVTEQLLQGVAFPLYVILPEGNSAWYNEEVAAELAEQGGAGMEDDARRAEAIRILTEAGYSWEVDPGFADAEGNVSPEPGEGLTFTGGQGLIDPDGNPVEQLQLVHPTAGYDPLRATFGGYIAGVAQEMGIPMVSVPTDFNKIIADVFATDPDDPTVYTSPFDMFILGYSLGNPAFPTFHGSFFGTGASDNNTQYSNEEYDAAAAAFDAAQTVEEAYEAMWEMERLIARDKPHVPLFDTGILEFYNNRVEFPFTETLSGLQFDSGFQAAVLAR
ncbi:MAG TPA: ABC transporter substrate-binding protein [Acidimicrobiia bacterium]|nr:ABC transporter substrate-binding protein [Acidimicrobiia bacterium]